VAGVLPPLGRGPARPRPGARLPAERAQQLALGGVDAEAVIVRVADDQVAVAVDAQPAGPPLAVVGRRPGGAEVVAVGVVDLDAGGEVDDVEAALGVEGGGPRAHRVPVRDAAPPPAQLAP